MFSGATSGPDDGGSVARGPAEPPANPGAAALPAGLDDEVDPGSLDPVAGIDSPGPIVGVAPRLGRGEPLGSGSVGVGSGRIGVGSGNVGVGSGRLGSGRIGVGSGNVGVGSGRLGSGRDGRARAPRREPGLRSQSAGP